MCPGKCHCHHGYLVYGWTAFWHFDLVLVQLGLIQDLSGYNFVFCRVGFCNHIDNFVFGWTTACSTESRRPGVGGVFASHWTHCGECKAPTGHFLYHPFPEATIQHLVGWCHAHLLKLSLFIETITSPLCLKNMLSLQVPIIRLVVHILPHQCELGDISLSVKETERTPSSLSENMEVGDGSPTSEEGAGESPLKEGSWGSETDRQFVRLDISFEAPANTGLRTSELVSGKNTLCYFYLNRSSHWMCMPTLGLGHVGGCVHYTPVS